MELLNKVIEELREISKAIAEENHIVLVDLENTIMAELIELFPRIIATYSDERLADVSADALYWPGQLERIISTSESMDSFALYDVLYNETYMNLLEYQSMICERNISLVG